MYAEATQGMNGDITALQSPSFYHEEEACLQFYYHMFGKHIGSLNIYIKQNGSLHKLYSLVDSQANKWQLLSLEVHDDVCQDDNCSILFESVRGNGTKGDIAIDDVSLHVGSCKSLGRFNLFCTSTIEYV